MEGNVKQGIVYAAIIKAVLCGGRYKGKMYEYKQKVHIEETYLNFFFLVYY